MNDSKFEHLKRLHELGFDLSYEEQAQLIDYADETEHWIASDRSLMGREIL